MTPTKANATLAGVAKAESADMGGLQSERNTADHAMCEAIAYSRGRSKFDNTPAQRTAPDFATFADAVLADRATAKGMQWIAAAFAIAPDDAEHRAEPSKAKAIGKHHRCKRCALPRRWLGLDVDGCTPEAFAAAVDWLQRCSALVYTTASHTAAAPRFRAVLELDRPATRAELIAATTAFRRRVNAALVGHAPLIFDTACDKPDQPLYCPPVGAWSARMDGEPLALGDLLADMPPETAQEAPQAPRAVSDGQPTAYALKALESACRAVASAPEGERNHVLNREAYAMGGLIPDGHLSVSVVEATLFDATRRAGYTTPEVDRRKIAEGVRAGMAKPRTDGLPPPANEEVEDGHLVEVPMSDVMTAKLTPPRFVVAPIIPRKVTTLLGGHGGLGKSMLGLVLCTHVAAGRGWGPFAVEQGRAVFVSLEDPGELVRYRVRCIIDAYELPPAEVLANLRVFDGADVDAALVAVSFATGALTLVEQPMMREVTDAAAGAALLVVDNASDAYPGDENDRPQVRGFMRRLARVARANDAGLVLLAHVDKSAARGSAQGNSYSGSTAWNNSARSRLALVEENGAVELRHEKANLSRRADTLTLRADAHGVLAPVAAAAVAADRAKAAAMLAQADGDAVLALLRVAVAGIGAGVPTATTGPRTSWSVLSLIPTSPAWIKVRAGKRRLEAALTALEVDGRIVRETHRTETRRIVQRWTLATDALDRAA